MDLETLLKRVDELENQLTSLKRAANSQNSKIDDVDDKASSFLERMREQKSEISRLNSIVNNLGQFDAAMTKVRVDFNKQLEESEKRNQLNIKMIEKVHNDEIRSINQSLEKLKKDTSQEFDQKLKSYIDENARLVQSYKEIEMRVDEKFNSEEFKGGFNLLLSEGRQNKKILDNLSAEFETYKKRIDELRSRTDIVLDDIRVNESRLNELVATENERKQSYINFMEQQALIRNERDRIWKDWETQFSESINQIYKLIPELQNQQLEMNKTRDTFNEITQKFERRANEITEIYRLMDEKFRKEWTTFKSDLEKKWSGVSLLFEDKQGGFSGQLEKINERILEVEDSTHDMQEALLLMSKEIQKGMQSLMNMVNGWMDAFGQIK
ncbi:MAG TPA: hypothetical protein VMW28_04900 [Pelolinea sp.]|nr:hypothetical protein [Pelolinea sp.]